MAKVCIVHGVGYDDPKELYKGNIVDFAKEFGSKTGAETMLFPWGHPGEPPVDPRKGLLFNYVRNWTAGIIMDFSHVLYNLDAITSKLPDADMYIGHSAGAVIVSVKSFKPQILMGCPLQLLRNVRSCNSGLGTLNIMHANDPIAAPVLGAENVIVSGPGWMANLNPVQAHTSYWKNPEVMDICVKRYKDILTESTATARELARIYVELAGRSQCPRT